MCPAAAARTGRPLKHQRLDISFDSHGTRCAAWLYIPVGDAAEAARPESSTPAADGAVPLGLPSQKGAVESSNGSATTQRPPVVVMAHGFSGTRDVRLDSYAEVFVAAGLACFVFDYRYFGDSEGQPRQLLDWRLQLQDWQAALRHVRGLGEVDSSRIALWGTSFGGGHALVTAAHDQAVKAVVAQVPHVDGMASVQSLGSPGFLLRIMAAAVRDVVQSALGGNPYYIPAVSPPGEVGCLTTHDSYSGFLELVPPGSTWRNEVAARILLKVAMYRPTVHAAKIRCPALVVAARHDSLIPFAAVEQLAAKVPRASLYPVDAKHFEVYTGSLFEQVSRVQADFLADELLGHADSHQVDRTDSA